MIAPSAAPARAGEMENAAVRRVICAAIVLACAPNAYAGDFDILRGTVPTYHWGGFYAAGQVGFSSANANFGTATRSEVAFILRNTTINADEGLSNWAVLPSQRSTGAGGLGGFVGYNVEWQDIVLGLEANYNRVSLTTSSSGSESRTFFDSNGLPSGHNYFYNATVSAQSSLHMTDIATFRARAGVEVSNFLPYGFVGFALGRANYSNSANVQFTAVDEPAAQVPPLTPLPSLAFNQSQGQAQDSTFVYGVTTGIGTDIGLLPNVFLRGELEYIYFFPVDGIHVTVASARVGAGVKF